MVGLKAIGAGATVENAHAKITALSLALAPVRARERREGLGGGAREREAGDSDAARVGGPRPRPPGVRRRIPWSTDGDGLPELTSLQQDVAGKKLVMDALAASDGTHALDVEAPPVSDTGARPQMKRQGSVSVDAAYRAMPTHHTPTEFDAKGSSGQSAWAGMMPDAAAAPPTPVNRASKWPGWKK